MSLRYCDDPGHGITHFVNIAIINSWKSFHPIDRDLQPCHYRNEDYAEERRDVIRHLTSATKIMALASLAMPCSAAGRALDPATDFCLAVTMDPNLAHALGFADVMLEKMSGWLIMPLQNALLSIDQVERPTERFLYQPGKFPACPASNKTILVRIRYSGEGELAPISVRTEIRMPGRPVFTSLHVITTKQIISIRSMSATINNYRFTVIGNSIKSEAASAARWILKGERHAI